MRAVRGAWHRAALVVAACLPLASALARASAPEPTVLVDVPLQLSSQPASSGVGTELLAWPSLRAGGLRPVAGAIVAGGDLTLSSTWASAGTDVVSVSRFVAALEARGLVGASFGGRFARLTPYAYAGLFGATGPTLVHGGASDAARLLFVAGARTGGGVLFQLGWFSVRSELGGGFTAGRPEVTASLGVGVAL